MKTKNIIGLVAIVAVAVAMAFNVTVSNKKTDTASLLALRNVEALADGESGDIEWWCSTYTSDVYSETMMCYDPDLEREVPKVSNVAVTRRCNNGLFSYCYPGYYLYSYDCDGNLVRFVDGTSIHRC